MNIWLRSETKLHERRTPLIPQHAALLLKLSEKYNFDIKVEKSSCRIYPDQAYEDVGCKLVAPNTWDKADLNHYILGIKELPEDFFPLKHQHIYFAHAFKNQYGSEQLLKRFKAGNGMLYDYEYLTNIFARPVVDSFRYWAGYCGAAISLLIWDAKIKGESPPFVLPDFKHQTDLVLYLKDKIEHWSKKPVSLIIGARGKSAQGTIALLNQLNLPIVLWDKSITRDKGYFSEILNFDLLFNCIYLTKKILPFLTLDMLALNKKLSIVVDISCDLHHPHNPLPIYEKLTDFVNPTIRISHNNFPVDVVAIDHLPSFLPYDSSNDFSQLLLPYLLELLVLGSTQRSVWHNAADKFHQVCKRSKNGIN